VPISKDGSSSNSSGPTKSKDLKTLGQDIKRLEDEISTYKQQKQKIGKLHGEIKEAGSTIRAGDSSVYARTLKEELKKKFEEKQKLETKILKEEQVKKKEAELKALREKQDALKQANLGGIEFSQNKKEKKGKKEKEEAENDKKEKEQFDKKRSLAKLDKIKDDYPVTGWQNVGKNLGKVLSKFLVHAFRYLVVYNYIKNREPREFGPANKALTLAEEKLSSSRGALANVEQEVRKNNSLIEEKEGVKGENGAKDKPGTIAKQQEQLADINKKIKEKEQANEDVAQLKAKRDNLDQNIKKDKADLKKLKEKQEKLISAKRALSAEVRLREENIENLQKIVERTALISTRANAMDKIALPLHINKHFHKEAIDAIKKDIKEENEKIKNLNSQVSDWINVEKDIQALNREIEQVKKELGAIDTNSNILGNVLSNYPELANSKDDLIKSLRESQLRTLELQKNNLKKQSDLYPSDSKEHEEAIKQLNLRLDNTNAKINSVKSKKFTDVELLKHLNEIAQERIGIRKEELRTEIKQLHEQDNTDDIIAKRQDELANLENNTRYASIEDSIKNHAELSSSQQNATLALNDKIAKLEADVLSKEKQIEQFFAKNIDKFRENPGVVNYLQQHNLEDTEANVRKAMDSQKQQIPQMILEQQAKIDVMRSQLEFLEKGGRLDYYKIDENGKRAFTINNKYRTENRGTYYGTNAVNHMMLAAELDRLDAGLANLHMPPEAEQFRPKVQIKAKNKSDNSSLSNDANSQRNNGGAGGGKSFTPGHKGKSQASLSERADNDAKQRASLTASSPEPSAPEITPTNSRRSSLR